MKLAPIPPHRVFAEPPEATGGAAGTSGASRVIRHRVLADLDDCLDLLERARASGTTTVNAALAAALLPTLPFPVEGMRIRDAFEQTLRYEGRFMTPVNS